MEGTDLLGCNTAKPEAKIYFEDGGDITLHLNLFFFALYLLCVQKKTLLGLETPSELYRPSDRRLSEK
jgi:hypothetical protein